MVGFITANPPTPVAADSNFKDTVLLLHGDGSNGAQNNTFLDSSSNNFTITRNGNTTQGTFSPFSKEEGKWGAYFDGNGDYLDVPSSSAFDMGTGSWTVEFFAYVNAYSTGYWGLFEFGSDAVRRVRLNITSTGYLMMPINGQWAVNTASTTIPRGSWVHVAVVCAGSGTTQVYQNGVSVLSVSSSTINDGGVGVRIGGSRDGTPNDSFNGHISSFRVLKGTALYTSNFTPPTAPLTAVTNTSLLCCQSNRFKDNSSNNFTLTPNGNVSVTPFSPFANSAAYSASVNGGSAYFDGSGDYLTLTGNSGLIFGTGDFTIEMFVFLKADAQCRFIDARPSMSTVPWVVGYYNSQLLFYDGTLRQTSGTTIPIGSWFHAAFVRSSGTLKIYVNGVSFYSASVATDFTNGSNTIYIGKDIDGNTVNGHLANVRVVKGTALYTSNFTPPTTPLTAVSNTQLLCNFTNAAIYDSTGTCDLETVGNAQISTSVKKYGTGAIYQDGSGDYLDVASNAAFGFGTGDFTVEFWAYHITQSQLCISIGSSNYLEIRTNQNAGGLANSIWISTDAGYQETSHTVGTGSWKHFAVTRASGTFRFFVDGTQLNTNYTNTQNIATGALRIGGPPLVGAVNAQFNGYIDELRITKGVARYTSNFTPQTVAHPDSASAYVPPGIYTLAEAQQYKKGGLW